MVLHSMKTKFNGAMMQPLKSNQCLKNHQKDLIYTYNNNFYAEPDT